MPLRILLADDDPDDVLLFRTALAEIPLVSSIIVVREGEELMAYLAENTGRLPDVLFLDLNMHRKTGFECLVEIKADTKLRQLPVIILSTSFPSDDFYEDKLIKTLQNLGASDFIRKPPDFAKLKEVIHQALIKVRSQRGELPPVLA